MSDNNKIRDSRFWTAVGGGMLLLAIVIGMAVYMVTDQLSYMLYAVLIAFGLYLVVSSTAKSKDTDGYGPSFSDASIVSGVILIAIAGAGICYSSTTDVILSAMVLIAVIALTGILMAIKNRNV